MPKIKGKIIRILDTRTVIINLGKEHGIKEHSEFSILGKPEEIVDPETKDVLGSVLLVKARVRASQVFAKFTIATTKWTEASFQTMLSPDNLFDVKLTQRDEGELKVNPAEVKPWKAKSEEPVRVGDIVEVEVSEPKPLGGGKTSEDDIPF